MNSSTEDENRSREGESEEIQVSKEIDVVVGGDGGGSGSEGGNAKLRLSSSILIHAAGIVIATVAAMASVQGKVDHLMQDRVREETTNSKILKRVTELGAKVDYLTEELRYIRAKTDRIVEKEKAK